MKVRSPRIIIQFNCAADEAPVLDPGSGSGVVDPQRDEDDGRLPKQLSALSEGSKYDEEPSTDTCTQVVDTSLEGAHAVVRSYIRKEGHSLF